MNFMSYKKSIVIIFLSFVFTAQASANTLSGMQKAMHTSPMPNLMMLIKMNAKHLALDKNQLEVINAWKNNNQKPMQMLMNEIIEIEGKIKQLTLEGISRSDLNQLKNTLLNLRGKLIDRKYLCTATMQKTLDEKQWSALMTLREQRLRLTASAKKEGNETQALLRVSPMPKLMLIILKHEKELALTDIQTKALEEWRLKNMVHWSILFDQVLQSEKKVTQQALAMESNNSLMQQFDAMAKKKREMAQMSLNCRDNMQTILSEHQWQEVVQLLNSYI